jgi:thiol-disulfide isomerase/thioredoxin
LSTLLLFSACGGESSTTTWPDVPIEDAFGNEIITSSVLDGRPTIVNVWAAWCEPCKKELPQLQNFAAVHSELNVLTVNLGDDPDKVSEFLELNSIDLPVLMDRDGRFTSAIKVSGVPTTVFVSADGEVVARHKGVLDEEESDDDLTKRRGKKSIEASGKGEAGSEVSDDASNKEPETEDSDAAVTPVKEHPAIAKVQRGRKQKPFSPSGVLTLTRLSIIVSSITLCTLCFSCTSFDYVF